MRLFVFLPLLFTCVFVKGQNKMGGTWVPVRQEIAGQALPPTALAGQKLIIADSTYTVIAESVDKGIARVNGDKLDIYGRDGVNKGKHFTAHYQLKDGQLIICYDLSGKAYPVEFDTKGHPTYFLSVFRKE